MNCIFEHLTALTNARKDEMNVIARSSSVIPFHNALEKLY